MRRRRSPLVCQHVENLSSAALEEYADIIRDLVHRQHGVYALYRRDKLYYVGLASNLRSRLRAHLRDRHKGLWDRFSVYLTIEDGHLRELESLVIRIAQPRGNKQRGKFARSENMTKLLVERLRERHRDELSELDCHFDSDWIPVISCPSQVPILHAAAHARGCRSPGECLPGGGDHWERRHKFLRDGQSRSGPGEAVEGGSQGGVGEGRQRPAWVAGANGWMRRRRRGRSW